MASDPAADDTGKRRPGGDSTRGDPGRGRQEVPSDSAPGLVPLEEAGRAFSLPPDLHYLNCAYMSPLPRAAEEAGIRGIRRKRVPTDIRARDFFEETDELRRRFARLIGSREPFRVAILPSASYGIAVACRNTPLQRGANVVLTHEQFPGNVYAWRSAATRAGAEVRMVRPPNGTCRGREWNERLLDAIDARTAAVSLGAVHWTDGTRFDLEAIGRRAREVGAAFVVDGTQSVGALPLDVETVRPDAVVVASYKWLLGPYALGAGWFGPRFDGGEPLEETWIARAGSEDFRGLVEYRDEYQPGAVRYDVGERSNFVLVPMLLASLELLLAWTPAAIQAHCRRWTDALAEAAAPLGYACEEPEGRSGHIVGLRAPEGVDPESIRASLDRRSVAVSLRGDAVRVSPHVYNDLSDLDALLDALRGAVV